MKKTFNNKLEKKFYIATSIFNISICLNCLYWVFYLVSFWFVDLYNLAISAWIVCSLTVICCVIASKIRPYEIRPDKDYSKFEKKYYFRLVIFFLSVVITLGLFWLTNYLIGYKAMPQNILFIH